MIYAGVLSLICVITLLSNIRQCRNCTDIPRSPVIPPTPKFEGSIVIYPNLNKDTFKIGETINLSVKTNMDVDSVRWYLPSDYEVFKGTLLNSDSISVIYKDTLQKNISVEIFEDTTFTIYDTIYIKAPKPIKVAPSQKTPVATPPNTSTSPAPEGNKYNCVPGDITTGLMSDGRTQLICKCQVKWSVNGASFTEYPSSQYPVLLSSGTHEIVLIDYSGQKHNRTVTINSPKIVRNDPKIEHGKLEIAKPNMIRCKEQSVFVALRNDVEVNGTVTWDLTLYGENGEDDRIFPIEYSKQYITTLTASGKYRLQASYMRDTASQIFYVTENCREIKKITKTVESNDPAIKDYLNSITKKRSFNFKSKNKKEEEKKILKSKIDNYVSCIDKSRPTIRIDGSPGEREFNTFFNEDFGSDYEISRIDIHKENDCVKKIVIYKK